jgi:SRSO17 transposase
MVLTETEGAVPPPSGRSPLLELTPAEVEALAEELAAYHAEFAPLFQRDEQRQWSAAYLAGQLLAVERKAIQPMAHRLVGGNVQAMQQFISAAPWDDEPILARHQELVAQTLGDPETGVLIVDGCDFPKQGRHSVGVARQYCGALGKVANCQASVLACYASTRGYTLVDRRLYLPEPWFGDDERERRADCGVPAGLRFQTRPQLALQMIAGLQRRGVLPFRWVLCDEGFGDNPAFLDGLAAAGLWYCAEVAHDTAIWRQRPSTLVPPRRGRRGRAPSRLRLAPDAPPSQTVVQVAAHLPPGRWRRTVLQEGSKGPLGVELAWLRVVTVRDGLPGSAGWLVLRRSLDEDAELKTYLSNAPLATPPVTFAWLAAGRWPVEHAIKEGKGEVGMDHFEVRGWRGWHHHLTMTLLAHHFLVRLRCRVGEKITGPHRPPSPSLAPGEPAPSAPRRSDRARSRAGATGAELRRLLLASPPHPPAPRFLLTT